MDRADFKGSFQPLLSAFQKQFDAADWLAYYQALEDVPGRILAMTVERLAREPREWFPKAGEIRAVAEAVRQDLLTAYPWRPCDECLALNGWCEVVDDDGTTRLARCGCRSRHVEHLEAAGIPARALIAAAVTGPVDEPLPSQTGPAQQLPPAMTSALRELGGIARAHRMPSARVVAQTDPDGRPL